MITPEAAIGHLPYRLALELEECVAELPPETFPLIEEACQGEEKVLEVKVHNDDREPLTIVEFDVEDRDLLKGVTNVIHGIFTGLAASGEVRPQEVRLVDWEVPEIYPDDVDLVPVLYDEQLHLIEAA